MSCNRFAACALALLLLPRLAVAGQINLRWSACWGDGGIMNKVFACNTNTGSNTLIGSFIPPQDLHQVSGMRCVVDLAVAGGSLPGWWQFHNAGSCRQNSLSYSIAAPPTAVNCVDWDSGQAVGSLVSYTVDLFGPGSARIVGASAAAANFLAELTAGQEYFAFSLILNNQKTVGTGACAGCEFGACLALKGIQLTVPPPANTFDLFIASNGGSDDRLTTWQGGAGVLERKSQLYLNCPLATPTIIRSWGEVKALYR
jgi:hypothetical protein